MANLDILSVDVESTATTYNIPSDARGLLRRFNKDIELSYKKWKKQYKEIESSRVYLSLIHI